MLVFNFNFFLKKGAQLPALRPIESEQKFCAADANSKCIREQVAVTRTRPFFVEANMSRLLNKIVLITGASAGIGEASAFEFAKEGSKLILTARRHERLESLKERLGAKYPAVKVHIAQLDVSSLDAVKSFSAGLPQEFKNVDVLVNNAGLALGTEPLETTLISDMDKCIDTNIKGVVYMIQAFLPSMKRRNAGHIINISSIAGIEPYGGGSVYCATKHALNALTQSLRIELVNTGVRVSTVSPGFVETEFSNVRYKGDTDKAKAVYAGMHPLVAQDIAEVIAFTANRPAHVQIADTLVLPSAQASCQVIARDL